MSGKGAGAWGSDYDGFGDANRKVRKRPTVTDRHGREMPAVAAEDKPLRRFRENIDLDRLELFMGERAEDNERYKAFLVALHDPGHARLTFATICRKFGVTLHELQSLYTDGMRHVGLLNMASKLPQVMEDVAEDSLSHQVVCARCDGKKVLIEVVERDEKTGKPVRTEQRNCPVCEGVGKVRESGDKHARDLVFESMKLTGQKGPMVAIQQNFGGGGGNGLDAKMEDMMRLTQTITMGESNKGDNSETS